MSVRDRKYYPNIAANSSIYVFKSTIDSDVFQMVVENFVPRAFETISETSSTGTVQDTRQGVSASTTTTVIKKDTKCSKTVVVSADCDGVGSINIKKGATDVSTSDAKKIGKVIPLRK